MSTWDHEPDEDRAAEAATEAVTEVRGDLPLEADQADAIEQAMPAAAGDAGERPLTGHLEVPLEVSEADAIDQALTVDTDDVDDLAD
jgi:hypothetical protein